MRKSPALSPAAKNLSVRVDFGSVRVQGSSQQDITYVIRTRSYGSDEKQARREFEAYKINASAHGDSALIEGDWQGHRHNLCSGEFVINVPRNLELAKLETSGGGVTVNGIAGRVEAESGGGKIHLDDIGGTVTGQTGGDSIEIGTVNGDMTSGDRRRQDLYQPTPKARLMRPPAAATLFSFRCPGRDARGRRREHRRQAVRRQTKGFDRGRQHRTRRYLRPG